MKVTDYQNIALEILRNDGKNNWTKLINVCKLMNINVSPCYVSQKNEYQCKFYLNDFLFPEYGYGKSILESGCDAVEKFLNRYVNIRKICSSNLSVNLNNEIVMLNDVDIEKSFEKNEFFAKIADLCLQDCRNDAWSQFVKVCENEKVHFYPEFFEIKNAFSCIFIINGMRFSDPIVVCHTKIETGRYMAERFIKKHSSRYWDIVRPMLISLSSDCQSLKLIVYKEKFTALCQELKISINKTFNSSDNVHYCKLNLICEGEICDIFGEGSTDDEALCLAIEKFLKDNFSNQIYKRIEAEKIFRRIATLCYSYKFNDSWKTLCNSCKLLGFKFVEKFYQQDDKSFSCQFLIEEDDPGVIGEGFTRKEAGNCVAEKFIEKYKDSMTFGQNDVYKNIVDFCQLNKSSDDWKTLCNGCKLLGHKFYEKFFEESDKTYSCSVFIDDHNPGIFGKGVTRKEASLSAAKLFFNMFIDSEIKTELQTEPSIKDFYNLNAKEYFAQLATICLTQCLSDSWNEFSYVCSKRATSLIAYQSKDPHDKPLCSASIGCFRYSNDGASHNLGSGFQKLAQDFMANFAQNSLSIKRKEKIKESNPYETEITQEKLSPIDENQSYGGFYFLLY